MVKEFDDEKLSNETLDNQAVNIDKQISYIISFKKLGKKNKIEFSKFEFPYITDTLFFIKK